MTLTTTAGTVNDLAGGTLPTQTVTSPSPYLLVRYNTATKAIASKVIYIKGGPSTGVGGILACDTYANLQAAATAASLTGTLSEDPTPHA